jgi:hypothetical protein
MEMIRRAADELTASASTVSCTLPEYDHRVRKVVYE